MSRLLSHVVQTASAQLGDPPNEVVLTHPANWGPFKLDLLDQAARLAGVERVVHCPEPLAAAAEYAANTRVAVGEAIAVYDLGGGTFDACVLEKTSTGFALLGTPEGIEHLGGIDFDEALFKHVLALLGDRLTDIEPDDPDVIVGLTRLHRDCVEAKEALSGDTDVLLPVALPGISKTLRLTRAEFEGLIRPALGDTITTFNAPSAPQVELPTSSEPSCSWAACSGIPLVGELLHHRFGTPTAMDTHPKHDIALGAVQIDHPMSFRPRRGPGRTDREAIERGVAHPALESTAPTARSTILSKAGALRTARRRRLAVMGTGAVAVLASIVMGAALVESLSTNSSQGGQQSVPSSPTRNTPTQATTLIGDLPRSAPLTPTQMLVQMQIGNQWDIWVGDANSSSPVRRLTGGRGFNGWPVVSPSFDSVIYIHANDNNNMDPRPEVRRQSHSSLRVAGAAFLEGDRGLFALPRSCTRASRVAWDPVDPSRLAVACFDADNSYHVWLMKTDGSLIRVVSPPAGRPRMGDVTFSPDGRLLAFWASADVEWDGGVLYTVPVDGGTPQTLVKDDHSSMKGRDADPVFSPDGKYVAFRRRVAASAPRGQFDIYRVDVNGTSLDRLTDDPANDEDPTWSRDSRHIAYKSAAATDTWPGRPIPRVWIMTVDGNDKRLLWTNGSVGQQIVPAWTPR